MFEEEQNIGGPSEGSSTGVDEGGITKAPYRPTELGIDVSGQLLKRTKAPVTPAPMISESDEVGNKDTSTNTNTRVKEYAILHEMKMNKVQSNTKIQDSQYEEISLHPIDKEAHVVAQDTDTKTSSSHPIPVKSPKPDILDLEDDVATDKRDKKIEELKQELDDNLSETVKTTVKTETAKVHEWVNMNKSHTIILERKASVGPCFRGKISSGISVCIPQKSSRCFKMCSENKASGININLSRNTFCDFIQNIEKPLDTETASETPKNDNREKNFLERLRGFINTIILRH